MDAKIIAESLGLWQAQKGAFGLGIKARVGQYRRGNVDQAERINAMRNKYTPQACFAKGNR